MPHENTPVYSTGAKLDEATSAMILLHGRGASAEDILSLAMHIDHPGMLYLAPQADGALWYPNRFLAPVEQNEPDLSAALNVIARLINYVEEAGIATDKIYLGGFSQGASLASEYVIRNPQRYGGLFVFSGCFIGPLDWDRQPNGDLNGMPAFIGCSDRDPYFPVQRVQQTSALLQAMHAEVTERIYPNMGHTINGDEIELARSIVEKSL